jgi:hypothetical protein
MLAATLQYRRVKMLRAISERAKNAKKSRISFGADLLAYWRWRRVQKRVLGCAYREFQAKHSACTDLCFDRHFLLGRGAEALAHRDADALAYAWTTQFRYRDERQRARDVRRLKPLAESFLEGLELWEARLGRHV